MGTGRIDVKWPDTGGAGSGASQWPQWEVPQNSHVGSRWTRLAAGQKWKNPQNACSFRSFRSFRSFGANTRAHVSASVVPMSDQWVNDRPGRSRVPSSRLDAGLGQAGTGNRDSEPGSSTGSAALWGSRKFPPNFSCVARRDPMGLIGGNSGEIRASNQEVVPLG